MSLSPAALEVLADYEARREREAELMRSGKPGEMMARRDEFLLPVGREAGAFLLATAVACDAKTIVEVGTSYGYSTLFLAQAARLTGGRLITIELAANKQAHARSQMSRAGLADVIDWRLGDAVEVLAGLDAVVDFALIDIWKELYAPCLAALYPRLAPQGVIVADNMIDPPFHREDARAYRAAVAALPDMQTTLLPIGSGMEMSCRWPAGHASL